MQAAMQYDLTLPADYDMEIIRRRVAGNGHLFDQWPGLGFKAFLIRERGVQGSPVNEYAPFYLWREAAEMADFLQGPGFAKLSADFGRPPVRHWMPLVFHPGPAVDAAPHTATRRISRLRDGEVPDTEPERHADLHSTTVALDPHGWELVRFTLWRGDTPEQHGEHYQVLHLAHPR